MTDTIGNVYWGDNLRLYRAAPTGTVEVVAGTGVAGFSGDGGDPLAAAFQGIMFGGFDPGTNELYVADNGNFRIRKISWR